MRGKERPVDAGMNVECGGMEKKACELGPGNRSGQVGGVRSVERCGMRDEVRSHDRRG